MSGHKVSANRKRTEKRDKVNTAAVMWYNHYSCLMCLKYTENYAPHTVQNVVHNSEYNSKMSCTIQNIIPNCAQHQQSSIIAVHIKMKLTNGVLPDEAEHT